MASTCNLCASRFIFVISTGRSGSTTLLESINALPGTHLRGELVAGEFSPYPLIRAAAKASTHPEVTMATVSAPFVHGAYNATRLLCDAQKIFSDVNPRPDGAVGGAKNLICHMINCDDDLDGGVVQQVINLALDILKVFPCSKIIFSIRLLVAQQVCSACTHLSVAHMVCSYACAHPRACACSCAPSGD